MKFEDIKVGRTYHYYCEYYNDTEGSVEAIVKITKADAKYIIMGDAISFINNAAQWDTNGLNLILEEFVKEVTKEENPEYFL